MAVNKSEQFLGVVTSHNSGRVLLAVKDIISIEERANSSIITMSNGGKLEVINGMDSIEWDLQNNVDTIIRGTLYKSTRLD